MPFLEDLENSVVVNRPNDGVEDAYEEYLHEEEQAQEQRQAETKVLSEVEARLYKANLYKAVLENPLFADDSTDVAIEVEKEYREFTLSRLNELLGIAGSTTKKATNFSEQEEQVLRRWAAKLLGSPQVLEIADKPLPTKIPQLQPVQAQPRPPAPVIRTVKAMGSFPASTSAPQKQSQSVQQGSVAQRPTQRKLVPEAVRTEDGVIHRGKKKYMEVDSVDAVTGKPKKLEIDITRQVRPQGFEPVKYPGQQAAIIIEAEKAGEILMKSNGKIQEIVGKATR